MKNKILSIMMILMLCLAPTILTSCGEDDPESDIEYTEDWGSDDYSGSGGSGSSSSSKKECRYCGGSGECSNDNCNHGTCIMCGGKGYTYSGKYKTTCAWCNRGKCNACKGSGKCSKCHGTGYTD